MLTFVLLWGGGGGADLVVLQAGDHDLGQDHHAGAAHPGAAVHQHRQVGVLGVADAVSVSPDRLDLLQVGCKTDGFISYSTWTSTIMLCCCTAPFLSGNRTPELQASNLLI